MQLYAGIDLHSNNSYLGISDEEDRRQYKKRLPNQADVILAELEPYRPDLAGIVVESTFNWYWLVDVLMDNGYKNTKMGTELFSLKRIISKAKRNI